MKKSELIDYIKRQLGYPVRNIYVTDDQINDAIQDAINDIKPWYTVFKYLTIDVNSSCIDLTEYKIKNVTDVIKVFDSTSKSTEIDPFSYSGMSAYYSTPMYATYKYATSRFANQNIHKIISSYAQMYQEQLYARLATLTQERTFGSLYENISWKFYDNKLYIDTCVPHTSVVTIEYIPDTVVVEDFDDNDIYTNYLRQLSTDFTIIIESRIVDTYKVSGSPVEVDLSGPKSDAQSDIARIREEIISKTSNRFYITD